MLVLILGLNGRGKKYDQEKSMKYERWKGNNKLEIFSLESLIWFLWEQCIGQKPKLKLLKSPSLSLFSFKFLFPNVFNNNNNNNNNNYYWDLVLLSSQV